VPDRDVVIEAEKEHNPFAFFYLSLLVAVVLLSLLELWAF
jgi:hypothetical protein